MSESLFASQWYRVARLAPKLRPGVINSRHYYRGVVWYVLTSTSNPTTLRLDAAAFQLVSGFDGTRTIDQVWQDALGVLGDAAPTQQEVIGLLIDLNDAELIDFQEQSDLEQMFEQAQLRQRKEARARLLNPLFMRFSLFDPDRLASRVIPYVRWMFSYQTFVVWLAAMIAGAFLVALHFDDIAASMDRSLLEPASVVIFWCVFPLMKALHEAAHALAVKRWGGEVHELGISLLIMMPVPYVDASESARFAQKSRRMAVAGAGIVVESSLAFLGLVLWVLTEPGLVNAIALNVFITGSLSSVLFNGNPLLKFDGYYVLSDLLEIPNLATRSQKYLAHLVKQHFLGIQSVSPVSASGEAFWFVCYGIAAYAYRLILTLTISMFVASQYFIVGVLLAIWSLVLQLGLPVVKALRFVLIDPQVSQVRARAWSASAALSAVVAVVLFAVPVNEATTARGVIWPVDDAMVRAGIDCVVTEVSVQGGEMVTPGTPLLTCDDQVAATRIRDLEADVAVARARMFSTRDRVERNVRREELNTATAMLEVAKSDIAATRISARASGVFYAEHSADLRGRFFSEGQIIGYVLQPDSLSVRAMLAQDRASLVATRADRVELVMPNAPEIRYETRIVRQVPAATFDLAVPALGVPGGGDLVVANGEQDATRLAEAAFEVELALPETLPASLVGAPVGVRFDHGRSSLARIILREIRLLFLGRFNV